MPSVRKLLIPLLALVTALAVGGGVAAAASASPRQPHEQTGSIPVDKLQAALDELVATGAYSSALVGVRDGEATWSGAAGVQDLKSGKPAHANGHFRAGSITKTFVATVVLQLVEEDRLSLDDPVERHLPGLVPGGASTTVRQLLNHTSGLFDYLTALPPDPEDPLAPLRRTYQPEELLKLAFAHDPYFPPGQGFHYSNTNYVVAGLLIEELTGNPYAEEVERRILDPLGLEHTSLPGTKVTLPNPHAHAYVPLGKGEDAHLEDITRMNPSIYWAAGELISTTGDLNRFYHALLGGKLLEPASLTAMQTPSGVEGSGGYGLGLFPVPLPCGSAWSHNGGAGSYLTESYETADGEGQLTLSVTPVGKGDPEAVKAALQKVYDLALC